MIIFSVDCRLPFFPNPSLPFRANDAKRAVLRIRLVTLFLKIWKACFIKTSKYLTVFYSTNNGIKEDARKVDVFFWNPATTVSCRVKTQLLLAWQSLTSVFGMGTGGSSVLSSPEWLYNGFNCGFFAKAQNNKLTDNILFLRFTALNRCSLHGKSAH